MRLHLALLACLAAAPAMADDACHDLWFARNAIMDRAGYCFGSALGQAVFDNADCTGKSVSPGPLAQARVARLQKNEALLGCAVPTGQTRLEMDNLALRLRLDVQPVRDGFESMCFGYFGAPRDLADAPSTNAPAIGRLEPGDDIHFGHEPEDGWVYVTTRTADGLAKSGGWLFDAFSIETCRAFAG